MTDLETELAKEMLMRDAADAALTAGVEANVADLADLRVRLSSLEADLLGLAEEALRRRMVIEEGAETFHRLTGRGPWVAVREHLVDLQEGDRAVRVPAWLITDGERYWSVPTAVLTTSRPATPAKATGTLSRFVTAASGWVRRLLSGRRRSAISAPVDPPGKGLGQSS